MYLIIVTGEWPNKNSLVTFKMVKMDLKTLRYLLSDYKKQNKQVLAGLLYAF